MKTILLLLCCSSVAFGQSDASRSLDRIADQLQADRAQRDRERSELQRKEFNDTIQRAADNIVQARLIKLQTERAARDAAAVQQQAEELRAERNKATVQQQAEETTAAPTPNAVVDAFVKAITEAAVKSKISADEVEQSKPREGRFQFVSESGVIMKLDTATGQTWQFLQSTNGTSSWNDVSDPDTRKAVLIQKRSAALNEWERETTIKDPDFAKLRKPFLNRATILIEKRTEEAGRMLSPEEMVEQAEAAYQAVKKSSFDTNLPAPETGK